jgi:hypothetical protein
MPLYIKFEDVRTRLIGKVRFSDDIDEENKMPKVLAIRLIDEAEGQVELDLSPRYLAPFQNSSGGDYSTLPDRPTRNILRLLCELQSCIRILETDFGSGTAVDASKYIKGLAARYKDIIENNVLARKDAKYKETMSWAFPPLPGLKKNYFNTEADDGYAGIGPLVTSDSTATHTEGQLSDPTQDFFDARFGHD